MRKRFMPREAEFVLLKFFLTSKLISINKMLPRFWESVLNVKQKYFFLDCAKLCNYK